MALKKNDKIELDIIDITNLGFGVGKAEGEIVFVADAVTGDRVVAQIIKKASSYLVGRVVEYKHISKTRDNTRCKNTGCKSCAYRQISYAEELRLKLDFVAQAFKKSGMKDIRVESIIPSPDLCEYRNKAQYPVAKDKEGKYTIGFFAPKSHRVTEAANCPLAPKVFCDILELLRCFFHEENISVYSEESGDGLLRHIYLRRGEISGEILLTLVINGKTLPHSDRLVKRLTDSFPKIVGILLNVNRDQTNVILGKEYVTLYGRDHIFDTLAGVELKITAPSFYQVNHSCAELLYAKAKELAAPQKSDTVLDLYCGAGSIGLSMAKECRELIGVEIVESAVECAALNAERNGISNAHFYTGDAADTAKLLENAERLRGERILPDIVILDPPRAGSDEGLLRHIVSLAPRKIVYISCNPTTLARDMAILAPLGYTTDEVTAVDMFPMTGHVESVVCLTRSDKST